MKSGLKAQSSTFNAIMKHLCCFSCRKQCSFFSYSHIFIRLVLNLGWFAEYKDGREFNMPSNKIVLTAFGKWWSTLNKIYLLLVACVLNYCNWKELLDLRWRIACYSTFCFFYKSFLCLQISPSISSISRRCVFHFYLCYTFSTLTSNFILVSHTNNKNSNRDFWNIVMQSVSMAK